MLSRVIRAVVVAVLVVLLGPTLSAEPTEHVEARLQADLEVVKAFRPAYPFWRHIFTITDGRIAFGSAKDGRLIVTFPSKGDWSKDAVWTDPALAPSVSGVTWPTRLDDRRDLAVRRLEPVTGPLVHNPTRGRFLLPNVPKYGPFLEEWSRIYERFAELTGPRTVWTVGKITLDPGAPSIIRWWNQCRRIESKIR